MIISATVIILKKWSYAFRLMMSARPVIRQAKQAEGVLHVSAYSRNLKHWHTLTAWESEEQMLKFMRSGAHLEVMRLTPKFAHDVLSARWEADRIPTKKEARRKLIEERGVTPWQ